jgi:hypothetical protein
MSSANNLKMVHHLDEIPLLKPLLIKGWYDELLEEKIKSTQKLNNKESYLLKRESLAFNSK